MQVVIAPDGFGGTLTAREAAEAIQQGWRQERGDDELTLVPLSDGGEGFVDVVAQPSDITVEVEVAGPLGTPVVARYLLRDGTAIIESALACGLALVPPSRRDPLRTTTYGVGQLVLDAINRGAEHLLVGLGGSATVDGGAGALCGLGYAVTVEGGSGLKVGAADLDRVDHLHRGWSPAFEGVTIELLSDVTTTLPDAARVFGPQKGADEAMVSWLTVALDRWAHVVERDLCAGRRHRDEPGTGAAGGLGFALMAAAGAQMRSGIQRIAQLVEFDEALAGASMVITGEGRLDATSAAGKVVAHVMDRARVQRTKVVGVVGQIGDGAPTLDDVEAASQDGPGDDPASDVVAAAARLARRVTR